MAVKLRRLKAAEWLVIKCLSTLLDPVAKTIEELGGQNYPTISLRRLAGSGSLCRRSAGHGDTVDAFFGELGVLSVKDLGPASKFLGMRVTYT
ncbi:hypothetical protein PC117_g11745 [Phytophthora cactorum]|uniref:Uncharacterized protein n=1 Tax=Phytophthora cactorum TaxID=29920 RepID=A0A8T1D9D9_9STRA|nr:hypothetical protein PC117_g11745 [Phytophthora cactorum]